MASIYEQAQKLYPSVKDDDILFELAKTDFPNVTEDNFRTDPNMVLSSTSNRNRPMVYDQNDPVVRFLTPLALFGQGASFGLADDIAGAVRGLLPGTNFQQERQNVRNLFSQGREARPIESALAELGGGLLGGVRASQALANTPVGRSLLNNLSNRSPLSRIGANLGGSAVAGGLLAIPQSESGNLGSDIATGALLNTVGSAVFQPVAALGERVVQNVAPAVSRLSSSFVQNPQERFGRQLRTDLDRDRMSADDVIEFGRKDPNLMLVDIPDSNVQALGDAFATLPGSAKLDAGRALNERARDSQTRLLKTVADAVGISDRKVNFDAVNQSLLQNMKTLSPQYEQILDENIVEMTPQLAKLLETPTMKNATKRAIAILQDERKPTVVQQFNPSFDARTGEVMEFTISETPSLHTFQKIKEGLDELIDAQTDITGKVSAEGARFVGLKNDLLKELDKIEAYKVIRKQYSTEKSAKRALELGRKYTREDSEVTERMFKDLSDNDQAFFKLGAARNLSDRIDRKGLDEGDFPESAIPQALTTLDAQRIRAVFDKENADKIINRFGAERLFAKTKNVVGKGSQTQPRQQKIQDMAQPEVSTNLSIGGALQGLFGNPANLISEAERDIAGRVLFRPIVEQEGLLRNLLNQAPPITRETARDRLRFDLTAPGMGGDVFRGIQFGLMPTLINRPNE